MPRCENCGRDLLYGRRCVDGDPDCQAPPPPARERGAGVDVRERAKRLLLHPALTVSTSSDRAAMFRGFLREESADEIVGVLDRAGLLALPAAPHAGRERVVEALMAWKDSDDFKGMLRRKQVGDLHYRLRPQQVDSITDHILTALAPAPDGGDTDAFVKAGLEAVELIRKAACESVAKEDAPDGATVTLSDSEIRECHADGWVHEPGLIEGETRSRWKPERMVESVRALLRSKGVRVEGGGDE